MLDQTNPNLVSVFVSYIFFNNAFNSFNFVKSVVQPYNLADQLGSLWDKRLVDVLVHGIEPIPESFIDGRNSMQLGVVGPHHCAVVADKFLARDTEVSQRLLM